MSLIRRFRRQLNWGAPRALVALWLLAAGSGGANAACADLRTELVSGDGGSFDVALAQKGLRNVLGVTEARLSDAKLGSYTRNALQRLCTLVPRYGAAGDVPTTVNLALSYGALSELVDGWRNTIANPQFLDDLALASSGRRSIEILRLAASPQMRAAVLSETGQRADCSSGPAFELSASAQTAANILMRDTGATSVENLCQILPVTGTRQDFVESLETLGQMESAIEGSLAVLQDPFFFNWLREDPQPRTLALMGSKESVLQLVSDFPRLKRVASSAHTPEACRIASDQSVLVYTQFDQAQLDLLADQTDIKPVFEALQGETYPTADHLWTALMPGLETVFDPCALANARIVTTAEDSPGKRFQLTTKGLEALGMDPSLDWAAEALKARVGLVARSKEALLERIELDLAKVLKEGLNKEVELAAATAAGSAEPVAEVFDEARVDESQFEPLDLPPLIGVTDASMIAIHDTISNPAFKDALENGPFMTASNVEQIKANVRQLLRGLIPDLVSPPLEDAMGAVQAQIEPVWLLTPELQVEIREVAQSALTADDLTPASLAVELRELVGVTYPTQRLFKSALAAVKIGPVGQPQPVSKPVRDRALVLATRIVDDVDSTRVQGPIAAAPTWSDKENPASCGCVPKRFTDLSRAERRKNSEPKEVNNQTDSPHKAADDDRKSTNVYGFYPFWLSPPAPEKATQSDKGDSDEQPEAAEAELTPSEPSAQPQLVDFELISQLAFYGLEFSYAHPEKDGAERNLRLLNREHWVKSKRMFVNSAHRHRARADVAFDLRGWARYDAADITYVVDRIVAESAPFDLFGEFSVKTLRDAIPTLFERQQPDGVTLILEGYAANSNQQQDVSTLIEIIKRVHTEIAPRGQRVNIALDLPLIGADLGGGVLNEFLSILTWDEDEKSKKHQKIVDKVLIFLERPTSVTKKDLRQAMERGLFTGRQRSTVLRSIIPVVSPGGHRYVDTVKYLRPGETPDKNKEEYSHFTDDLVYFQDNFAGIGFWPAPSPEAPETARIKNDIAKLWNVRDPIPEGAALRLKLAGVCTYVCPNRAYFNLISIALFGLLAVLIWRSYYNGTVNWIAFRLWGAPLNAGVLAALLGLVTICDPVAFWPPIFLGILVGAMFLLMLLKNYMQAKSGPKP